MSDSTPDSVRRSWIWAEEALSTCGLPACAKVKAGCAQGRGDLPSLSSFLLLTSPPTMIGIHPMEGPAVLPDGSQRHTIAVRNSFWGKS